MSTDNSGVSTPTIQYQKQHHSLKDAAVVITNTNHDDSPTRERRRGRAWLDRLRDDVSLHYADMPLLACCIISGLCDSVAFNATGTFASMQTGKPHFFFFLPGPVPPSCSRGVARPISSPPVDMLYMLTLNFLILFLGNTIFLALGAASLPPNMPHLWLRALVSITSFWAGCFAFSQARRIHPLRKTTLAVSFLAQAIFILAAAALAQSGAVPAFSQRNLPPILDHDMELTRVEAEEASLTLLPLALLAFQFGGQIVASRVLGYNEVPTNVLTSLYCDLLSDPGLLKGVGENPKRNRRVAAIVLLILGGVVGGWLQRSGAGMATVLWIAGGMKVVMAAGWIGWRGKHEPQGEKQMRAATAGV